MATTVAHRPVSTRRLVSLALAAIGIALLANPWWLTGAIVYPTITWADLPLFQAALTGLGLVSLAIGLRTTATARPRPSVREGGALGVLAIVVVTAMGPLATLVGIDGPATGFEGYAAYRGLIAGLVVGGFLLGIALRRRDRGYAAVGCGLIALPFAAVALTWLSGAVLKPVLEASFFFTASPVLGIPYLGTGVVLGVVLSGWVVGARST